MASSTYSLALFPKKNNKIRILSMGNFCSIFHAHFDKLVSLTNSHKKAVFLDKCLFWWQISKYTLGDEKIWFTRKLSEIAKELSISERSVSRYLDEFEKNGFIERICKLSASNKNNNFTVTKRLYIHVTPKLLNYIQTSSNTDETCSKESLNSSFSNQNGK
ncbi:MarR family transcriptional regulator, partial [Flavobacterium sp.]|uniref:helix-turn-helix transcriptional regulator n=1 Tax=Flavobacterium sp. TaxID=239 RepID=UPI0025BB8C6E